MSIFSVYLNLMFLPIYAIHVFRPKLSIGCFLVRWCIRSAIRWHQADIISKIGHPRKYHWVIWWVNYLYVQFFLVDLFSRNLHRSPQGSWMATIFKHWTVRAFKAGSSHFYTLHVFCFLPPENFHNGGKHWVSRSLPRNAYGEIWWMWSVMQILFSTIWLWLAAFIEDT